MLRAYRDVPNIKNQFDVCIPVFMINMKGNTRKAAIQSMKKKGYEDVHASEHLQEFVECVFDFHRVEFGKEHEANICRNDNDVWKMFMKNKYNHIKKIVHLKEEMFIDIFDDANDFIYYGAKIKPWYKDKKLDSELSEIRLYQVHPAVHDGVETFDLSFDELKVIMEKIDSIPKIEQ